MVPKALPHPKIIKKRVRPFRRFQFDRFKRIPSSWRRPIGIDSPMRRQYKGMAPRAKIGYGSDKRTRHLLPCGFYKVRVFNVKDLEPLVMHNDAYAAEIASNLSWKTREKIIKMCREKNIKVLNKYGRMETTEKE